MDARELRIGNLLQYSVTTVYVLGIHQAATLAKSHTIDLGYYTDSVGFERHENDEQLSGIPLSPEWLERLGVQYDGQIGYDVYWYDRHSKYFCSEYTDGDGGTHKISKCEYVHQLQNLYYALTGKELELKP